MMLYEYMLFEKLSFEEPMEEVCNKQKVPGAVLVAHGPGARFPSRITPGLTILTANRNQVVFVIKRLLAGVSSMVKDRTSHCRPMQLFGSAPVPN
jgi:hypothetical protein